MDRRIKEFLHEKDIQEALDASNFDYIYKKYEEIPEGTSSLTDIFLKSNINFLPFITKIYTNMFASLKIKSITIPNSVTNIAAYAFSWCKSLKSITIPRSVTKIEEGAFYNCISLSSIIYQDTKKKWEEIVKGKYWNQNVQIKFIHCTDGDINIKI